MGPRTERALRWFVGVSLVLGALVLLAGGLQLGTLVGAPSAIVGLAALVAILLSAFTATTERRPWPAMAPAAAWIVAMLLAILWAHFDPLGPGHVFLSGFTAIVAFATGLGILARRLWAWPVALASVAGFGPLALVIAPLDSATVAAGFALFLADVFALLALHRAYYTVR